ncbi:MAG: iron-sulfur cluster insertion protein ErpA [Acidimicrobiales bacterium]
MAVSSVSIGRKPKTIELSATAVSKITELLSQEEGSDELVLRIAVKPGGCSGYSYDMFFDSELEEGDIVSNFENVRVAVDPQSAALIKGATLDYKDGLQGAGFHISNPNATKTCGCGSSFS